MKKLLGPLLLSFLFLVACGDDETAGLSLIGTTWTEVSSVYQGCDDDSENGTQTCTSGCESIVFNSDGSFVVVGEQSDDEATYEVSGNQITITVSSEDGTFTSVVRYAIVGTTLTITVEDDFDGCTSIFTYVGS